MTMHTRLGVDVNGLEGRLHDLWRLDASAEDGGPVTARWHDVGGATHALANKMGVYNQKGVISGGTWPGARDGAPHHCVSNGARIAQQGKRRRICPGAVCPSELVHKGLSASRGGRARRTRRGDWRPRKQRFVAVRRDRLRGDGRDAAPQRQAAVRDRRVHARLTTAPATHF